MISAFFRKNWPLVSVIVLNNRQTLTIDSYTEVYFSLVGLYIPVWVWDAHIMFHHDNAAVHMVARRFYMNLVYS